MEIFTIVTAALMLLALFIKVSGYVLARRFPALAEFFRSDDNELTRKLERIHNAD
ncbi:hypothetical protein [Streptomyces sp. NPDC055013]